MISDLDQILSLARQRGADQAEVYAMATEETPVQFEANRLKQMNARQMSGAALRVIKEGRIGFASSTRPQELEELVQAALETAPFGPEAKFDFPRSGNYPRVDVYDPEVESVSVEHMVHQGQSLIDAVRVHEPDLQCDGSVRRSTSEVACINSNGGNFTYRGSVFSVGVSGTLVRGTDMLFVGDDDVSCRPISDYSVIEKTVAVQLERCKEIAKVTTGEMPVIFTPDGVASAFAMPLRLAFSGRMVHQGQSPLIGRLGQPVYHAKFSLIDDATLPYRPASRSCDDEGIPSRRIPLAADGVVHSFLYDLQTAGLAGTESTGSGERSLSSQPSVSTSSLLVREGDASFDEMVAEVKEGLVVE